MATQRRKHLRTGAVAGLAVLAFALVSTAATQAAFPGANGKIAFSSPDGIGTINADGTGLAQIGTAAVRQPDWSPDGQRIVFVRDVAGCRALLTANPDGSAE